MTPVMKFLKNAWEKHVGTFAEGPNPPPRLTQMAEMFARANPHATVAEWAEFCGRHAGSAYQEGYIRGFERGERLGPDWEDPDAGAALLEKLDDISTGMASEDFDPTAVVPIDGVPQEHAARTAIAMNELLVATNGQRRGPSPR